MRFTINQKELLKTISTLLMGIPKKTKLPILQCVKMVTTNDGVQFTATDLDSYIQISAEVNAEETGEAAVDLKELKKLISGIKSGDIEISDDDNCVTFRIDKFTLRLPKMPTAEFPELPECNGAKHWFDIHFKDFQNILKKVSFVPIEDPRPFLRSISFEPLEGKIRLVSTDVNRLAVAQSKAVVKDLKNALIDSNSIKRLEKITSDDFISFYISEKWVFCKTAGIVNYFRIVDAQFPNWLQVVPQNSEGCFTVDRKEFAQALNQLSTISDSIIIDTSGGFSLALPKDYNHDVAVCIKAEQSGQPYQAKYQTRFFLEFLKAADSQEITGEYTTGYKPLKLNAGDDYLYIVMPQKL
jgi:DNA polymerase-3 subunit beta